MFNKGLIPNDTWVSAGERITRQNRVIRGLRIFQRSIQLINGLIDDPIDDRIHLAKLYSTEFNRRALDLRVVYCFTPSYHPHVPARQCSLLT